MPLLSSLHRSVLLAALMAAGVPAGAAPELLQPALLVVDRTVPATLADAQVLAARRYASFWNSGDPALAREALAPGFMDRTLPPGRAQGVAGPLAASQGFRAAVPDLSARIEQMLVVGDRVVVHLRFNGHFSGEFQGRRGQGQVVDFIATDIYRVAEGRIAENWHLEDNLTLMQQLGLIRP